jgi:hypothetical protein
MKWSTDIPVSFSQVATVQPGPPCWRLVLMVSVVVAG